jgi:hypothetical protein
LGDKSDIVYGKMRTSNVLTGYGTTLPLEHSNHWQVDQHLFIKLIVAPVAAATRVSNFAAATNPKLNYWALSVKSWT